VPSGKKWIQQVVRSLLYYVHTLDPTIITVISALELQQATATEETNTKLLRLLNYCASHPDSKIWHTSSDTILNIHSDAGYLNESKARSRAGGHFVMSSKPKN
jgi:hypothetical protein